MINYKKLFRSTEETITPVTANILGQIPEWLEGSLIRNGTGIFDLDSGFTVNHFNDGYAVLFKFSLKNGKVEFTKRTLQSDAYLKAQLNGKPFYPEYGTKGYVDNYSGSAQGFLARAFGNLVPNMTDNCNTEIIQIGNSYFASRGNGTLRLIYPENLGTGEKVLMAVTSVITTRFKRDKNGDVYLITPAYPNEMTEYEILRIPSNSNIGEQAFRETKSICKIAKQYNGIVNTFCLSRKYIVFIEQPHINQSFKQVLLKGTTLVNCSKWMPQLMEATIFWFHVIEKETGNVFQTIYESERPFYFQRVINCFEEEENIIVDLIGYDSSDFVLNHLFIKNLRRNLFNPVDLPQARRYCLPIIYDINEEKPGVNLLTSCPESTAILCDEKIQLNYRVICSAPHEFPVINSSYFGLKYRYYYATGYLFRGQYESSVIKVNVDTGVVVKWFAGEGQIPSEATFIERPDSSSEDDGILIVCITSSQTQTDRLVILDAITMQVTATANVPCHIPLSRYGTFITDK